MMAFSLWGGFVFVSLSSSPVMAVDTASNTAQEQQVARDLLNNDLLGRDEEEAIASYNDLITRFGNSHDPELQEQAAKAQYLLLLP